MTKRRLTPNEVTQIYAARPARSPEDQTFVPATKLARKIARNLGIVDRTVRDIWDRRSWRNITRPLWSDAERAAEVLGEGDPSILPAQSRKRGRPRGALDTVHDPSSESVKDGTTMSKEEIETASRVISLAFPSVFTTSTITSAALLFGSRQGRGLEAIHVGECEEALRRTTTRLTLNDDGPQLDRDDMMTPQAFERWGITAGLSTRERPGKSLPATQTCSEGGTISEMIPSGRVLVSMAPVIDVQAEQASRGNTADAWGVIEDAGSEEEEEMAVGRQVAATHLEQVPSSFHAEDVSAIGQEDPFLHDWKAALKRMHATCRPSEDTLRSQTQAAELLLKQRFLVDFGFAV